MSLTELEITIEQTQQAELDAEQHLSRIRHDRRREECKYATGGPHYSRLTRLRTLWRAKLKNAEDTLSQLYDNLESMLLIEQLEREMV